MHMRRLPIRSLAGITTLGALALAGCGTQTAGAPRTRAPAEATRTLRAQQVMRLTQAHEQTGMTLAEGPVFDEDGQLLVVDVTAPAGEPKVLRVNVQNKTSEPVHTDARGTYTSAQFGPYDGRIYLTDFSHGDIVSLAPDGGDPRTFFSGEVDGSPMNPDDLAFDREGKPVRQRLPRHVRGRGEGPRVVRIDRARKGGHGPGGRLGVAERHLLRRGLPRAAQFSELTQNRVSSPPGRRGRGGFAAHRHPGRRRARPCRLDRGGRGKGKPVPGPARTPAMAMSTTSAVSALPPSRYPPVPLEGSNRRPTWPSRPAAPVPT